MSRECFVIHTYIHAFNWTRQPVKMHDMFPIQIDNVFVTNFN